MDCKGLDAKSADIIFSVECKSTAKPLPMKRQALLLYLEGLGFNSIGKVLGVSHVSVMNWIKKFGREVMKLKSEHEAKIIEIDELHTYIKKKLLLYMDCC